MTTAQAQTRVERGSYFARREARLLLARGRRLVAPAQARSAPVLLTSIPKAGTHLAERALDVLPGTTARYLRTLRTTDGWERIDARTLRKVRVLRRGEFAVAHLPASPPVLDAVQQAGARVVCVVRDPRDVLISKATYLGEIDTTHPWHARFRDLSPQDRRRAVLDGVPGLVRPLAEGYERFAGWTDAGALTVRFEDLVGVQGGGSAPAQRSVVTALVRHVELPDSEVDGVLETVFSTRSLTFNGGQIGRWRSVLDADEADRVAEQLRPWLELYGYDAR